jgi:2-C-methyl-D-erythritol 4-phosphate cytidylyltransferase
VVLAGGRGERFGDNRPKQFIKLAGKSIIEYTIEAFDRHPMIDEILVVSRFDDIDRVWEIVKKAPFKKVEAVIAGGKNRFDSTHFALKALKEKSLSSKVIFHDGVRPLVSKETITLCLNELERYEAVDTAMDATDTVIKIDNRWIIEDIPDRTFMKRGQTPQGFRLRTVIKAYELAVSMSRKRFTCDCGVVREMLPKVEIKVVKSTEKNLKITYPIDLHTAEKYVQMGIEDQFESLSLKNLKGKKVVIFGNSSGIGAEVERVCRVYGAEVYGASRKSGVDISKREDVKRFFDNIGKPVDVVINTASILIKKPFEMMSFETIEKIIDINYKGAINVAYLSRKPLSKSGGMLINFASSSYTRGRADYALYSSSKAAIVNFTQALSDEWSDVKVNCINPERTKTPMREKNFGYEPEESLLRAEDVAIKTLKVALSNVSGMIVDVKRDR